MNLDKALVSAILEEGRPALERALSRGISVARLRGEGRAAFEFLLEYSRRYGSLPVVGQVEGKTRVILDTTDSVDIFDLETTPPKSADWFIDEVNTRYLGEAVQEAIERVSTARVTLGAQAALQELEKAAQELREAASGTAAVESLFKLGPDVVSYFERIRSGERGIQTPWPTINNLTMGFWPEDLILFAARTGAGKSFVMILLALYVWNTPQPKTGKRNRVLFVTTEMAQLRIGLRAFAFQAKIPYGGLNSGFLDFNAEARLRNTVKELENAEGLYIIGGDFDFKFESVSAAIESCKPDIIIIDGIYLLRYSDGKGASRTERMAYAFDDMKRLAKTKKIPVVITSQFNREVKKDQTKTVQMESLALSDVGAWNADLIFGLIQTEDMKRDKKMIIKPLKVREGEAKEVTLNWDFTRMIFDELVDGGGGGGDADESGALINGEAAGVNDDSDLPF